METIKKVLGALSVLIGVSLICYETPLAIALGAAIIILVACIYF